MSWFCKCGGELQEWEPDLDQHGRMAWPVAASNADCLVMLGWRGELEHDAARLMPDGSVDCEWHLGKCEAVMAVCRECGCTDLRACDGDEGEGCFWVEPDLCSSCGPADLDDFG